MKSSITNRITSGQKKQIAQVCGEAASKAAREAVEEAHLTRRLAQEILSEGNKLQAQLKEVVGAFICKVSIDLRAVEDAKNSLRPLGLTLTIPAKPECVVANCFINEGVFFYRDSNFDSREWLPGTLPASGEVKVTGHGLTKITTEAELAKIGGTFTNLLQIEDLILRTEKGENTGLMTNSYANIFFLQIGKSVFMVRAYWGSDGWYVDPRRFGPRRGWDAGLLFFSCVPSGHLP